jgi:micrococcal nuclease
MKPAMTPSFHAAAPKPARAPLMRAVNLTIILSFLMLTLMPDDAHAKRWRRHSGKAKVAAGAAGVAVLGSPAWVQAHGEPGVEDAPPMLNMLSAAPTASAPNAAAGLIQPAVAPLSVEGQATEPFKPGEFTGVVTHVTDGDTVWVALPAGSRPVRMRLEGIDAPEICQALGPEAKAALSERVLNRAVTAKVRAFDSYGRRLGKLYDDTEDIGQRLVKDGLAWSLRYRWDRGPYMAEERMAKALNRGVHKAGDAEEPRVFRKRHGSCKAP